MTTFKKPEIHSKFILVTTQRSGSTWVIDMLNSHPEIAAYGELFLNNGKGTPAWCGEKDIVFWNTYFENIKFPGKKIIKPLFIFNYLNQVYSQKYFIKSVGFKLMYQQMSKYRYGLLAYILFNKVSIIHLIRANHLDVILSQSAACVRGVYHSRDRENIEDVKINLDTLELVDRLKQQEKQICKAKNWYSNLGLPYMEVTYEDLATNKSTFNKILDFIGIEHQAMKLSSSLKKINPKSHAELIANYESVKATLQATHFYQFLR
ncbi:Stf0 family sulfotransferase [Gloeocapsopsis dulcis]|uniref:Sulfotransferase domain-containing protein n=1 Tax=Gloeocapsopsis dulcis AAB1 = 1H9 TaxID=1433147 RepID=A0A6N8G2A4_9CHRO|nr:Stf0 family sulfotransferase [Gloeocapsopsis dulcis]MUL39022.1 hypothetical protein [Gloeocapsopsis dulcis AAB1 = 1H9]WNN90569.1 Stf0 family sulfotransferase [Gloeocapsopsis dulcis]